MEQSQAILSPPGHSTTDTTGKVASQNNEKGRTHGLPLIFWLMEQPVGLLLAGPTVIAALVMLLSGGGWVTFAVAWVSVPPGVRTFADRLSHLSFADARRRLGQLGRQPQLAQ